MPLRSPLARKTSSFSYRTSTFHIYERMDYPLLRAAALEAGRSFLYKTPVKKRLLYQSSGAGLFPMTTGCATMPASNSHGPIYTKDSQMVEVGGTHTDDEAELARMGYKQELKCVQLNSSTLVFRC